MESMREALEQAGVVNNLSPVTGNGGRSRGSHHGINMSEVERWTFAIGGGALALYGLRQGSLGGVALAIVGGALVYRGTSGYCPMYEALGINTAGEGAGNPRVSVPGNRGVKVEKSITIDRSPEELYRFWRNFENLPHFMDHLESVRDLGGDRSHWKAKAPAGATVEWDAEIYNDKENELIAWRSLEGADVDNAGSVRFEPSPDGRGAIVKVALKYDPPGGIVGSAIARLFGEAPDQQIEADLRHFKQVMELGETPTAAGQPSGHRAGAAGR